MLAFTFEYKFALIILIKILRVIIILGLPILNEQSVEAKHPRAPAKREKS